ncbi:sodium symporter-like protein [Elsinoe australis]|uniref:Sodium symporter-like protein n=1 Tax=Elsinoe australis TaxID=40998 RepID=A0A4U7AN15_9PEZI|nr:sodium symporter-like protein [Elsinoe australis]
MDDRSHGVIAVAITMLVVSVSAMALRLYVRLFMIKSVGWDDYTMIGTLLIYVAFLGCEIGGWRYGTGRRLKDLERDNAQQALMYWWLCEVFYSPATSLLKVSVGLFLLRITVKRLQIWIIRFFMAGSVVFGLFWTIITINQCKPVSFWWDLNPDHKGTCINATVFTICAYAISVLNSSADFAFAILPMFILRETTMNKKSRTVVCILLGVASIAAVATIVRIPFLHTMNHYKGDFLYNTTQVAMLSALEVGLGITAACAATLRPLFQNLLESHRSGYATPKVVVHDAESMHLRQLSKGSMGAHLGMGIKKTSSVEVAYKKDSWTKLPEQHSRSESVEHLTRYGERL